MLWFAMPPAFFGAPRQPQPNPEPSMLFERTLCDTIRNGETDERGRMMAARKLARGLDIAAIGDLVRRVWPTGAPPPYVVDACADGLAALRKETEDAAVLELLNTLDPPDAA